MLVHYSGFSYYYAILGATCPELEISRDWFKVMPITSR